VEQVQRSVPIADLDQAGAEKRLRNLQADDEIDH
jgi:hypothetical protein